MKKRCKTCSKLSEKWQKVNGSSVHCFDGCFSTTGSDNRTIDGKPAWLPSGNQPAWDPRRMIDNYLLK